MFMGAAIDMVQRVVSLSQRISQWRERVNFLLYSEMQRLTMQDAKSISEEGEKLKLSCDELKTLRNEIRSCRSWLSKVKKSKAEHGATAAKDVEKLLEEHDGLLIAMPGELEKLKQAVRGYCLCRRPYEGFMIGCDGCDEWYHGSCVGVSETRADRFEKYVCVRCCTKKVFVGSCTVVANVIKKWTCEKDRKKFRQIESQKHQRRVRKEKKDRETFVSKIAELTLQLESLYKEENKEAKVSIDTSMANMECSRAPFSDMVEPQASFSDKSQPDISCPQDQIEAGKHETPCDPAIMSSRDIEGPVLPDKALDENAVESRSESEADANHTQDEGVSNHQQNCSQQTPLLSRKGKKVQPTVRFSNSSELTCYPRYRGKNRQFNRSHRLMRRTLRFFGTNCKGTFRA
jgi:hypothetical protein